MQNHLIKVLADLLSRSTRTTAGGGFFLSKVRTDNNTHSTNTRRKTCSTSPRAALCLLGAVTAALGLAIAGTPNGSRFLVVASDDASADLTGAPPLQSFVWAQWDGKAIFIGGRTGGYHGVG